MLNIEVEHKIYWLTVYLLCITELQNKYGKFRNLMCKTKIKYYFWWILCKKNWNFCVKNVNRSDKKYFCNIIKEIPLAFIDFKALQNEDEKCREIISSIKDDTYQLCYFTNNDILMYKNKKRKSPDISAKQSNKFVFYKLS